MFNWSGKGDDGGALTSGFEAAGSDDSRMDIGWVSSMLTFAKIINAVLDSDKLRVDPWVLNIGNCVAKWSLKAPNF